LKKETVSFDVLGRQKRQDRNKDARRLAAGEVTPSQLQDENSVFASKVQIRIISLAASIKRHYAG